MRRFALLLLVAVGIGVAAPRPLLADGFKDDGRAGVVTAIQGVAVVRPVGRERWTPLDARSLLFPGDVIRTEARGANALEVRLAGGGRLVVGPGAHVEIDLNGPAEPAISLFRGDVEVKGSEESKVLVTHYRGWGKRIAGTVWLRATDTEVKELSAEPKWLTGYRSSTSEEWMGSLLATVDGKNVPLTVGYHKVTVEIRDQIARTTVEESFVNSTDATLEGTFSFPLPAEASISGFGMWIGDELVEADLVEKQRARQIYEDILRRKKDPGLLEWEGGNLFKARVFPILPHAEKRIRIRYTEVLPLEGDSYRYRYALRSELLRLHPLRELSIALNVVSSAPITDVASSTHPVTLRKTEHEAVVEFGAQQYTPERDFEVAVTVGRGAGLSAVAHRRGEDGFFMLLLAPAAETAANSKRDLVPDGAPLDLIFVADTSGSMDPGARAAQSAFLSAVLTQCSAKDRFRLLACDVEPRWIAEEALPVTEENVAKALAALDARFSLGWTDLGKTFDAVLAKAGPGTQVIYAGDGIETASDAAPAATADRIRAKGKDSKATFHAVSTSAAYEKPVLEAISSIGGGSLRRADTGAAQAAKGLFQEIARPSLKDVKVEIKGLPTAKIYPEVLPNVPVGQQQVVLGRFLPGGDAKSAEVVVTGTLAGKPVTYTSSFAVPPSDEDASFLPRLWARRHLDALLAGKQDPKTKEEIVAFSREYQIMTPYTSFLVLENDEDRALYGVERTVKMRDAERFFADARDKAALEIARKQATTSRRRHDTLRRRMLREIEGLGRSMPVPAAYGWTDENGNGDYTVGTRPLLTFLGSRRERQQIGYGIFPDTGVVGGDWDRSTRDTTGYSLFAGDGDNGVSYEERDVTCALCAAAPTTIVAYENRERLNEEDTQKMGAPEEGQSTTANYYIDGYADKLTADAPPAEDGGDLSGYELPRSRADDIYLAPSNFTPPEPPGTVAEIAQASNIGSGFASGKDGVFAGRRESLFRSNSRGDGGWPFTVSQFGFPALEAPPAPPRTFPEPAWDPLVLQALHTLDRRPALAQSGGAVKVTSTWERLDPVGGRVEDRARATAIVSATKRHVAADGFRRSAAEAWLTETERGALDAGTRLGRNRAAIAADREFWPLPLADRSLEDVIAQVVSARRPPKVSRAGDLVTILFTSDDDLGLQRRLVVDVSKSVLVEERRVVDGEDRDGARLSEFVSVGGRWWATKVETLNEVGRVAALQTLTVEALDTAAMDAAFASAMAAHEDAIFLGGEDRDLKSAKQAAHDGRASLADRLVLAGFEASRQRWDDAWKHYEAAEALVTGKPGTAWTRLALLARSRRGEAFKDHALAMANRIGRGDDAHAADLADRLDQATGGLGGEERLSLVHAVSPAWTQPGPYGDLWTPHAWWRHVSALEDSGARRAAREERADLARKQPRNAAAVIAHAVDLRDGGDTAAGAAYLTDRVANGGPWGRRDTDELCGTWARMLWDLRDLEGIEKAAIFWVATRPRQVGPYQLAASILWFRGRHQEGDRWVLDRLNADVAALVDPAARAERAAAIQVAIGRGWNFWAESIPSEWRAPLASLALRLARSDGRYADLAQSILSDWRFRQTEEGASLPAQLLSDLKAEGAVASMPLPRLSRYVGYVQWNSGIDEALGRRIVDALLARWRAAVSIPADYADARILAGLVRTVIDGRGALEERIAFLRERLAKSSERDARTAAQELFDSIVGAKNDDAREAEAFALLPRLLDARDEPDMNRYRAAAAARSLATWVHDARKEAALGPQAARAKWTRAESRQHQRDAEAKARTETAARFATAVASADATIRPWLEIERIDCLAESQADLAKSEGEGRELLDSVGRTGGTLLDQILAERAVLVLEYAVTRRGAPKEIADRVTALLRSRLGDRGGPIDVRYEIFRLLVALDKSDELEKDLTAWVSPDDVEITWRVALAYVQSETNRPREAAATMEAAAALDDIGPAAGAALAGWYLVLKEDARREATLDRRFESMPDSALMNGLQQESYRVSRQGEGVPPEIDSESLRALRILLAKTESPGYAVSYALNLYRPTKDFRVLECLADGVLGHSPGGAYTYLEKAAEVIAEIHEEATCGALLRRLEPVLARATTDTDRRAVRLLLAAVESRAGAVPKAEPAHARRALVALQAAFDGDLAPGERALLSGYLASMGAPSDPAMAEEQLRRLEELFQASTRGAFDRLANGERVAKALWARGRKDEAADRLQSLLAEARDGADGTLLPEANDAYETLLRWWTEMGQFKKADARLRMDLAREARSGRRESLQMRLFGLYVAAVEKGGETGLGSGAALFRAAAAEMEQVLLEGPAYQLAAVANHHGALHEAAAKSGAAPDAGAQYLKFVRERLPRILTREPLESRDILHTVLQRVHDLGGPLAGLTAILDFAENEPAWFERIGRSVWGQFGSWAASWRFGAGAIGAQGPRLLPRVLKRLELTLLGSQQNDSGFWLKDSREFWAAHAAEFAAVAARVAEENIDNPTLIYTVAEYQRSGLGLHPEGIATLLATIAHGKDPAFLRDWLLRDLVVDHRYAEAWPVAERLIAEVPDDLNYRLFGATALHGLARDPDALKLLEDTVARWRKGERWSVDVAFSVAQAALGLQSAKQAAEWIEDALRMRQESGPRSRWGQWGPSAYGILAHARSLLGQTDAAVRAAAAGIVGSGEESREDRDLALKTLYLVIAQAKDLDAWVAKYEADVATSGMDAPAIRKALGRVLLDQHASDRAATQLRAARDLDPADAETHALLVRALDEQHDAAGALEALFASVRMAPKNLDAYPELAKRYEKAGDAANAERARTNMVEAMPSEPDGHRALAKLREASGSWPLAVAEWHIVTRLRADEPEGWIALAEAQIRAGDKDAARATVDHLRTTTWDPRFGDVAARVAKLTERTR